MSWPRVEGGRGGNVRLTMQSSETPCGTALSGVASMTRSSVRVRALPEQQYAAIYINSKLYTNGQPVD